MSDIKEVIELYTRKRESVMLLLAALRTSRKYGFPIISQIGEETKQHQMILAARFLLSVSGSWQEDEPAEDDSEFLHALLDTLSESSLLNNDCRLLLGSANGNTRQIFDEACMGDGSKASIDPLIAGK